MIGDDYAARAQANAPRTPAEGAESTRELARQGFSDHTISSILRIDVQMVRRLIGERAA